MDTEIELKIPDYYLVKNELTEEQESEVLRILSFAPPTAAVVTDLRDVELARRLCVDVIQADSFVEAVNVSEGYRTVILIPKKDAKPIEAFYREAEC